MDDIFSQFGDVFSGSGFESFFGGGRQQGRRPSTRRGTNLRIKLKLTLEEIANGAEKKIKVKRNVRCEDCGGNGSKNGTDVKPCGVCNGTGQVRKVVNTMFGQMVSSSTCHNCHGEGTLVSTPCPSCNGEGRQMKEETISLKVPAGVTEGMQLSMSGKGNVPPRGGIAGDLLIVIEEVEDALLKRDGLNIIYDLYLGFIDAVLGTEIEVPTIDGKAKIKIESGTQGGKILRLKGKGIKDINGYEKGDQLIHINVWTPKQLSKDEKSLLMQLKDSENFKPNPGKAERGFFEKMKEFF